MSAHWLRTNVVVAINNFSNNRLGSTRILEKNTILSHSIVWSPAAWHLWIRLSFSAKLKEVSSDKVVILHLTHLLTIMRSNKTVSKLSDQWLEANLVLKTQAWTTNMYNVSKIKFRSRIRSQFTNSQTWPKKSKTNSWVSMTKTQKNSSE